MAVESNVRKKLPTKFGEIVIEVINNDKSEGYSSFHSIKWEVCASLVPSSIDDD